MKNKFYIRNQIDEAIHSIKSAHSSFKKYPDGVKEALKLLRKAKKIVMEGL